MLKYLMLNCKEATFLMAKKEEKKISLGNRIKLFAHTMMCSVCKKFEKQATQIGKESKHLRADENLPVFAKERMERMLDEHLS